MTDPQTPPERVVFPPDSPMGWGWCPCRYVEPPKPKFRDRPDDFATKCNAAHQFIRRNTPTMSQVRRYFRLSFLATDKILVQLQGEGRVTRVLQPGRCEFVYEAT
jgi:hypothetical protein